MKKTILIGLTAFSLLLVALSGCVEEPAPTNGGTCGDGSCDIGETEASCPEDCLQPPMPEGTGSEQETPPALPF